MPDWMKAKPDEQRNGVTVLQATIRALSAEHYIVLLPKTYDNLESGATNRQVAFARAVFAIRTSDGVRAIKKIVIRESEVQLYLDLASNSIEVMKRLPKMPVRM